MIKAVVFDLEDTLISERQYVESGFRVVAKYISESSNINSQLIYETMISLFEKSSKQVFNRLLDYFKLSYTKKHSPLEQYKLIIHSHIFLYLSGFRISFAFLQKVSSLYNLIRRSFH